jgi:Tfp pilus assembly protein PilX
MRRSFGKPSRERGSVLIIAMIALVALAGLGGFTALSVQSGIAAQSAKRFQGIALYAAESGVAAGMDFLRRNIDPIRNWTALVEQANTNPQKPTGIHGNLVEPGDSGNPFSTPAWYEVSILNNASDPGFNLSKSVPTNNLDQDARVILRVVGHGPSNTSVTLEVEVTANNADRLAGRPCPSYAQKGLAADGSGRNDCIDTITAGDVEKYNPSP